MSLSKLLTATAFAFTLSAQGDRQPSLDWLSRSLQRLVDQISPAVVQISGRSLGRAAGTGSGVIVDSDGYVVTNAHVVAGSTTLQVLLPERNADKRFTSVVKPSGKLVAAELVGFDRETDIAVLKIAQAGLPALKLADSETLRQGELVLAAGSPFGLQNSVTMGVVSSVARQVRPDDPMIYIQTDAPINPGNSGGPLLNAAGDVIGINTFILSEAGGNVGVGFAVPSSIARSVYEQIRKHGRVRRGQIGVVVQTITPVLATGLGLSGSPGAIVADVASNGAAAAAGLQVKDVIVSLDGKPIENARQFGVNIYQKAGQTVTLEVLRHGENKTLPVSVLERPQDPDRLLTLIRRDRNLVPRLELLAVDLDQNVTSIMGAARKLAGAVVVGVPDDGSAASAGLRPGDVIYEVNNRAIGGLKDLMQVATELPQGLPAVLHIERAGQLQFVEIDID